MEGSTEGVTKKKSEGVLTSLRNSMKPRIQSTRFSLYLFRRSPLAVIGLVLVLSIVLIAIFAPILAPPVPPPAGYNDVMMMPNDFLPPAPPGAEKPLKYYPPGEHYIMGTGLLGTDIYYGVIWGARTSIYIALYVVFVAIIVGLVLGAIAGYYGGIIDEVLMRVTDVFLSIPGLILAMAVAAVLTKSLENTMLALIVVWWPPYARIIRGQVISIKQSTYVEAAKAVGSKRMRILFRHIVPNSISPIIINATMDIGVVVLVAAGLSFIGFGPPVGYAEWGKMVSDGYNYFVASVPYPFPDGPLYNPWWTWVFPGLMIFLFVMGFNLLGDGLRDILDPRLRK